MASITCSSDQRLSTSKRRLKPLMLRDYLLDDLSSCSSNGFKSFPRRQPPSSSSTVRRLLDAEIKRSGLIHHHRHQNKPRLTRRSRTTTCGTAISNAVHKASTAFLNAVKLIPFHSTVTSRRGDHKQQQGGFSRSFSKRLLSKRFWRKPVSQSRREVTVELGDGEIQWWISAAFSPEEESLDQPSDLVSQISTVITDEAAAFSASEAAAVITTEELISGADSSSSGSELFTNSSSSETVQSSSSSSVSSTTSSGDAEGVSNGNDAVAESGESLNARDSDGSSVKGNSMCNREESVNEEKEQLSPVSILECPFQDDEDDDEDDAITDHISNQNDTYEKNGRNCRRVNGFVRLEPLDLEKRIEKYVESEEDGYSYHMQETEEDESESRANRLFALVKSRIGETNNILASNVADNLLLDYLQKDNIGPKEEALMVKKVEDWVLDRQDEMFMTWEVREMRQVYVKEMKWGCINEDGRESVVEDLANGFFTFLVDEFVYDLAS